MVQKFYYIQKRLFKRDLCLSRALFNCIDSLIFIFHFISITQSGITIFAGQFSEKQGKKTTHDQRGSNSGRLLDWRQVPFSGSNGEPE